MRSLILVMAVFAAVIVALDFDIFAVAVLLLKAVAVPDFKIIVAAKLAALPFRVGTVPLLTPPARALYCWARGRGGGVGTADCCCDDGCEEDGRDDGRDDG